MYVLSKYFSKETLIFHELKKGRCLTKLDQIKSD